MVAIMNGPRAKKFNKFKKRNKKFAGPPAQKKDEAPRELPKNDTEAKVHLITQDIKFAQALAGNDKRVRDKFLKNLKKWLNTRSNTSFPFSDQDFLRLWKGLFYCMWMSDKPLIQEQLCEDMGSLFYCFDKPAIAVQFYGRFLETMSQEWIGIDHWRLDKFMMLVRRVTRHCFRVLHKHEWSPELLKDLRKEISGTVLKEGVLSYGCTMHWLNVFWEEVSKVTEGKAKGSLATGLTKPFLAFLTNTHDKRLSKTVVVDIFYGLLKQSDLGRQYEEKYEVWKQFGFPSERLSDLELVEDDQPPAETDEEMETENGDEEKLALDPRAGNVSVVLPEIPFNARKIHALMEKAIYDAGTRSKNRVVIKKVMAKYEKFIEGVYPLGIQKMVLPQTETAKLPNIDEKVQELESLEEEALQESRLMKTMNKSEKKKFYQSGLSMADYLKSIGKRTLASTTQDSNGTAEPTKKQLKVKRKSLDQNGEVEQVKKKKKTKVSASPELNSSTELDNGFEVVEDEPPVVADKPAKGGSSGGVFSEASEWDKPLEEGEMEFFVTPTKQRLKHLNADIVEAPSNGPNSNSKLVKNPFASNGSVKKSKKGLLAGVPESPKTPVNKLSAASAVRTPTSSAKRVKIVLERNMAQEKSEYFKQLRASPQIPFDSNKKPTKGLLKPHSMPSPINPYYKKKIGLKLDNE